MADHPNKNKDQKPRNKFISLASSGLQIGITIWLGNELGQWLDAKFQKEFFEIIITLVSIFISIYLMIMQVINISKEDD